MADKSKGKAPSKGKQNKPADSAEDQKGKEEIVLVPNPVAPTKATAAAPTGDGNHTKSEGEKPRKKEGQAPKPRATAIYEKGKGIVKAVPSGDTLVVISLERNHRGPPMERRIALASVTAPALSNMRRPRPSDDKTAEEGKETKKAEQLPDEPYAWDSRDFLRKAAIGKEVVFVVEHKTPGKEYGWVYVAKNDQNLSKKDSLSHMVVSNGWGRVRRPEGGSEKIRPEIQELIDAEDEASKLKKGVHNKEDDKKHVRPFVKTENYTDLFAQLKGQPIKGIIEKVDTGSKMRVTLLPSFADVKLLLSGVECPDVPPQGEAQPFGREAKFFTEHYLLHREVDIMVEGVDKKNFYGTVSFGGHNIGLELLKSGLGKYVDWSGARTPYAGELRAAEKAAQEGKMRIWAQFQKPEMTRQEEKKQLKPGKEIIGKVVDIVSPGAIQVQDTNGNVFKTNFSSIRIPYQASQQTDPKKAEVHKSFASEAKEYLRKRLIGQRVRCVCDYINEDKASFSVYLDKNNIAVELVEQGYATALEHKAGAARSKDYEHLLLAEERARKLSKGFHQKEPNMMHISDLSTPEAKAKAKQHFPMLKRAGKLRAVVQYEFSASRFKVYVPKETCEMILSLSALKTPRREEPFAEEALRFVKEQVHLRDVEIEVIAQDKGGNFIGTIWVNKQNLSSLLLEQGFATLIMGVARDSEYFTEYVTAEEVAKKAKRRLWQNYDEQAEQERRNKRREESEENRKPKEHLIDVIVTEIIDATKFYVQIIGSEAEQLEDLMKELAAESTEGPFAPQKGDAVKAQFTADDRWYRAKVTDVVPEGFKVFYIDYGNSEVVPAARIRRLDAKFQKLPPQAHEASLAYIVAPAITEEYGEDAADALREAVEGNTMLANVESKDGDHMFLTLVDRESQQLVNASLLRQGLARVERVRGKHLRAKTDLLKKEEQEARSKHLFIWQYGDPGSDEEDGAWGKKEVKKPAAPAKAPPSKQSGGDHKPSKEEKE